MLAMYWFILAIGFVLLWIFLGGRQTEFVGLKPLFSKQPLPQDPLAINPFITDHINEMKVTMVENQNSIPGSSSVSRLAPKKVTVDKSLSKGQAICKKIMEELYQVPFTSARPAWLKNPETGGVLEIDCYNDELGIGVEYNGIQHYIYPNVYHKSLDEFTKQVRRDQYKIKKCEENGVYLITVPYNIPHHKIQDYILDRLPIEDEDEYEQDVEYEEGEEGQYDDDEFYYEDDADGNEPTTICYKEYYA